MLLFIVTLIVKCLELLEGNEFRLTYFGQLFSVPPYLISLYSLLERDRLAGLRIDLFDKSLVDNAAIQSLLWLDRVDT